jgi:hypothetical protein
MCGSQEMCLYEQVNGVPWNNKQEHVPQKMSTLLGQRRGVIFMMIMLSVILVIFR